MKVFCGQDGCHFPKDFEETLKPPCNFWGDQGCSNLPTEAKKKIWDWLFSMPCDEIAITYNTCLLFQWSAQPIIESTKWENSVSNWDVLTEAEKQQYQKDYFKKQNQGLSRIEKLEKAKVSN